MAEARCVFRRPVLGWCDVANQRRAILLIAAFQLNVLERLHDGSVPRHLRLINDVDRRFHEYGIFLRKINSGGTARGEGFKSNRDVAPSMLSSASTGYDSMWTLNRDYADGACDGISGLPE